MKIKKIFFNFAFLSIITSLIGCRSGKSSSSKSESSSSNTASSIDDAETPDDGSTSDNTESGGVGCTDATALNYDSTATTDSQNCEYVWGQLIDAQPLTYFAYDLSDDVKDGVKEALRAATESFGKYGLVEYWVVGSDYDAMVDLATIFCERRISRGESYQGTETVGYCVQESIADYHDNNFLHYYNVANDAIAYSEPRSSAATDGGREYGLHRLYQSYPHGFEYLFGDTPIREAQLIFHEYFAVFQGSQIDTLDEEAIVNLLGPWWFSQGAQEYTSFYYLYKHIQENTINIDPTGLGTMEDEFSNKMTRALNFMNSECPDTKFHEIDRSSPCRGVVYDIGPWTIAYLQHKIDDQDALITNFYPILEANGWDATFTQTFGIEPEDFYTEFEEFLNKPLSEQLLILPTFE